MHLDVVLKLDCLNNLENVLSKENFEKLKKDARYASTTFSVNVDILSKNEIEKFLKFLQDRKARQAALKVKSYLDILDDPNKASIKGLKNFKIAADEIIRETPNKWIFIEEKGEFLPYLVQKIEYVEASGRGSSFSEAQTRFSLLANTIEGYKNSRVIFCEADCAGNLNFKEILANKNIILENEDLVRDFKEQEERYLIEKKKFNKQYKGNGIFTQDSSHWSRDSFEISNVNLVNDEEINKNSHRGIEICSYWITDTFNGEMSVPHHPYLYVYNLSTYENGFIHISNVKDYVYDDSLRDKLVLPSTHRDLIDILSDDLSILSGDIVEGKSTGTTILCKGVPGTGKTLTAEVYSEVTHRPLYKVNAGILGLEYSSIEKNLEEILKRAERWGAVLLIDEADTYIRKRGNDNAQNAVVAAFLRTLEYFNGLLFLTTNRSEDIDDAIESRCIAQILYEIPEPENALRIWKVLANEFNLDLSDELIEDLVKTFPKISGRDIKELLRLTGRFCNGKGYKLELKHFISCAQFRGLHIVDINKDKK